MPVPRYPTCETCKNPIYEKDLVEGREGESVFFFHKAHAPKKNIFFRHRIRERRLRRQLEQAAELQTSAASARAAQSIAGLGEKNPFGWHPFKRRIAQHEAKETLKGQKKLREAQQNPVSPAEERALKVLRRSPAASKAVITLIRSQAWHERKERDWSRLRDLADMEEVITGKHHEVVEQNPHYPAIHGKAFERKWERLVMHVKASGSAYSPWAVATATLGGYPASRAKRNPFRGTGFRRGVRSFRGKVKGVPRKHPRTVRAFKTAGKVGVAATQAAFPEVEAPLRAARGVRAGIKAVRNPTYDADEELWDGLSRTERKKLAEKAGIDEPDVPKLDWKYLFVPHQRSLDRVLSRAATNPTPSRSDYLTQQLDRAQRYITAGKPGEAHKYIERVMRIVDSGRGDPDENATFRSRARSIEEAITTAPSKESLREKAIIKMSESIPSLEKAHAPPPDPEPEFWGQIADEARRKFPGRDLSDTVTDVQYLWHYALSNQKKWDVVEAWNATKSLDALDEGFWTVFEAYLDHRMQTRDGRLVIVGPATPEAKAAMKNPGGGKAPIVQGAKAVRLSYRDRNGILWVHSFEEDSLRPKLRVKKGLLHDKIVVAPTTVGPAGIGDEGN
jgi:hypothetical protein